VYYGITDAQVHALTGYGDMASDRIQDLCCAAGRSNRAAGDRVVPTEDLAQRVGNVGALARDEVAARYGCSDGETTIQRWLHERAASRASASESVAAEVGHVQLTN